MENIEENNRLIAKFMATKNEISDIFYLPQHGHYFNSYGQIEWNECFRTNELKYHSSWDWLMSVVEKIEKMSTEKMFVDVRIQGGLIGIYVKGVASKGYDFLYQKDGYSNGSKIEAVWLSVVEFIKWYNSKK